MNLLGRTITLLLMIPIVLTLICAFWAFNINRVAMDPMTYKGALEAQNFYTSLLPAFIDAAASSSTDPQLKAGFQSLVDNMSLADWTSVSDALVLKDWLKPQVDRNIDRFFSWLDGTTNTPSIAFNLTELKTNLSNTDKTKSVANIMIPRMPVCTKEQTQAIKDFGPTGDPTKLPLCDPSKKELRDNMTTGFTEVLAAVSDKIPAQWTLAEQIKLVDPGINGRGLTERQLDQFRAQIWVFQRLIAVLFLIPLGLMSLIVILVVRSGKQFFRWVGWGLVATGILTAITWFLLPTLGLAMHYSPQHGQEFGQSGQLISGLAIGLVTSITSALSYGLLIQIAVALVLGFIAVALSIILPGPPPQVTKQDVQAEEALTRAQFAMSPAGATPVPMPTPPPMPGSSSTNAPS